MHGDTIQSFIVLALGFATAGVLSSAYQWLSRQPASFRLLQQGVVARSFLAVPFLAFAAPFVIMRNTLTDRTAHARRMTFVMMATILAGFWSLMSGTVLVMTLRGLGLLG